MVNVSLTSVDSQSEAVGQKWFIMYSSLSLQMPLVDRYQGRKKETKKVTLADLDSKKMRYFYGLLTEDKFNLPTHVQLEYHHNWGWVS